MLGQAHTPRRRLVALAVAALAILAIPAVGGADPHQDATSLRTLDAQLAAKQRSAVLGLYAIDRQLAGASARLAQLHAQATALRAQAVRLRYEELLARHDSKTAQARLAARLRALYDEGTVSPVEILLGARSLDQALGELDSLDSATGQDKAVLRELEAARATLGRASEGLAGRRAELAASTHAAEATAASLAATRSSRTSFIASLAHRRSLTEQQVARVVAQARTAATRSVQIQRTSFQAVSAPSPAPTASPAADTPAPAAAAPAGARTLTVTATGYSLGGTTATGLPVGWGVAAVDPSVIALGTHFSVPGYGDAVAADTGGAVGGDVIDLWFPTVAQANAWGRRTVTIVLR